MLNKELKIEILNTLTNWSKSRDKRIEQNYCSREFSTNISADLQRTVSKSRKLAGMIWIIKLHIHCIEK